MDQSLRIDLDAVIRSRLPRHYRWIPRWFIAWLERVICQKQMNALLEATAGQQGADFCRSALDYLDVDYTVKSPELLPTPSDTRVIYVSNHPLGGLDGLALIDMVTRHHGCEPWFMVNDLLMAVTPLRRVFLPINKHGAQSRTSLDAIDSALASSRPVIIFPAGLVSRRQSGGRIADLEWRKTFINYARKYGRDIIPLYFGGRNSGFFYKFAHLRQRVGIPLNIEMVRLPRELFLATGSRYPIAVGRRISHSTLCGGAKAAAEAAAIKEAVYSLDT